MESGGEVEVLVGSGVVKAQGPSRTCNKSKEEEEGVGSGAPDVDSKGTLDDVPRHS